MIITRENIDTTLVKEFFIQWCRLAHLFNSERITGPIVYHYIVPCMEDNIDPFRYESLRARVEHDTVVNLSALQVYCASQTIPTFMTCRSGDAFIFRERNTVFARYEYVFKSVFEHHLFKVSIYLLCNHIPRFISNLAYYAPTFNGIDFFSTLYCAPMFKHVFSPGLPNYVAFHTIRKEYITMLATGQDGFYNNSLHFSELLLLARGVYDHPHNHDVFYDCPHFSIQKSAVIHDNKYCCICHEHDETRDLYLVSKCSTPHSFHLACATQYIETKTGTMCCPLCKKKWDQWFEQPTVDEGGNVSLTNTSFTLSEVSGANSENFIDFL
jgi:hypothetical protein